MAVFHLRPITNQDIADFLGISPSEMTLTQNRASGEMTLDIVSPITARQREALSFFITSSSGLLEDVPASVPDGTILRATATRGNVGATVTSEIRMAAAPNGLAGYILIAKVVDPTVAKITDVIFPATFPPLLASHTPDPVDGPTVRLTGTDLNQVINVGDEDILLATIQMELLEEGFTTLTILASRLDDDTGTDIVTVTRPGSLVAD